METKLPLKISNKIILLLILFQSAIYLSHAQVYVSKFNTITFFSEAPLEDIKATSNKVVGYIDIIAGEIKSNVVIKSFMFEKELMRQHFNEHYLESHIFPSASFNGQFTNTDKLKKLENGTYEITGNITIHGVTRQLTDTVSIVFTGNKLIGKTKFFIKVADHKIDIPRIVIKNIAEIIEVNVVFELDKIK